ncbi:uncharacterized protein LOC125496775 [Beta vulgaris subsp. vulgaris]|uniref:uncharacterized protein LOC125496775 n=1 Tax=Beta vulgaris subsp. vulgaris TaxID=3555 RepID=UPI0020373F28|nr:uncharacterized protein LOC125496775 [Beta vulgaris subsp. vulgaris]
MGRGFYSLHCGAPGEKSRILSDGPWFVMGSLVWVQAWQAGFKPSQATISQYPIWINLPELPLEFYHKEILHAVGNAIGNVIKIDAHSLTGDRKRFAAICVLMKADQPTPSKVWLGASCQELVFSESPWVCMVCQKVGHATKSCLKRSPETMTGLGSVEITSEKKTQEEYAWKYVGGKKKVIRPAGVDSQTDKGTRGHIKTRWTPKKPDDKTLEEREIRGSDLTSPHKHGPKEILGFQNPSGRNQNAFAALQVLQGEVQSSPSYVGKRGGEKEEIECLPQLSVTPIPSEKTKAPKKSQTL